MKRIAITLALALLFLNATILPAANLLEGLKQTLSSKPPELFLVYPTQGKLSSQEAILRFNVAQLRFKKGDAPFKGYTIQATFTDASGKTHEFTAPLTKGHTIDFALPQLPIGPGKLTAKLFKNKRKEAESTLELTLNVMPEDTTPIPEECHIDKFGRTIMDGDPFLPIGIYFGAVDEDDDLELFLDSDFNCIMPYNSGQLKTKTPTTQETIPQALEFLDKLNEHGKKIIFSVKDIYNIKETEAACGSIQKSFGGETPDDTVTTIVNAFKDHPALLAWYNNDEITLADRSIVDKRRQLINSLDPNHPTWGVLCDYAEAPLFASSCDVIGVDPYPIGRDIPAEQERCIDAMDAVERSGQSCWAVPQTFNWGNYKARKDPACYDKYRMPTLDQMRGVILYEALRGARGFICYCFYDLKRNGPTTNYPLEAREPFYQRWADVKSLATMLKSLEPWLLAEPSPVPVKLEIQAGRAEAASLTDAQGKTLYILANIGPDNLNATLKLPEGAPTMNALYGHATEIAPGTWQFTGNDVWGEVLIPVD